MRIRLCLHVLKLKGFAWNRQICIYLDELSDWYNFYLYRQKKCRQFNAIQVQLYHSLTHFIKFCQGILNPIYEQNPTLLSIVGLFTDKTDWNIFSTRLYIVLSIILIVYSVTAFSFLFAWIGSSQKRTDGAEPVASAARTTKQIDSKGQVQEQGLALVLFWGCCSCFFK